MINCGKRGSIKVQRLLLKEKNSKPTLIPSSPSKEAMVQEKLDLPKDDREEVKSHMSEASKLDGESKEEEEETDLEGMEVKPKVTK